MQSTWLAIAALLIASAVHASESDSSRACNSIIAQESCTDEMSTAMPDEPAATVALRLPGTRGIEYFDSLERAASDRSGGSDTRQLACPIDLKAAQTPKIDGPALNGTGVPDAPNTTLTVEEVTDLSGTHPQNKVRYGLTRRGNIVDADVTFRGRPAQSGDGICFWVTEIELSFTPVHVFLAKELSPDSCAYRVVWSHELVHVKKLHDLDAKFRRAINAAIRGASLPSAGKPEHFDDLESGKNALLLKMVTAIAKVLGTDDPKIRQRLATGDRQIWHQRGNPFPPGTYYYLWKQHVESWDSDASYNKQQAECSDWPY
jgi:hypothetical protein